MQACSNVCCPDVIYLYDFSMIKTIRKAKTSASGIVWSIENIRRDLQIQHCLAKHCKDPKKNKCTWKAPVLVKVNVCHLWKGCYCSFIDLNFIINLQVRKFNNQKWNIFISTVIFQPALVAKADWVNCCRKTNCRSSRSCLSISIMKVQPPGASVTDSGQRR